MTLMMAKARLSRLPYSDWAKAEAKYILINYCICTEL